MRGIHRSPVNSPHKWPVTRKSLNLMTSSCVYLVYIIYVSDDHTALQHNITLTMSAIASQITSPAIVCSTVYSGADQRKHQSSASLAFAWGIHRRPVNSPDKWSVTRKMFQFDDMIMHLFGLLHICFRWPYSIIHECRDHGEFQELSCYRLIKLDTQRCII